MYLLCATGECMGAISSLISIVSLSELCDSELCDSEFCVPPELVPDLVLGVVRM